jgi:hypothetical protein
MQQVTSSRSQSQKESQLTEFLMVFSFNCVCAMLALPNPTQQPLIDLPTLLPAPHALLLQCSSVLVNMWRESAVLLRALWDAVPAVRPVYVRFIGGMEDLYEASKRCEVMACMHLLQRSLLCTLTHGCCM